ncbi:MAG: DUF4442 domain-containing protein [Owenweeksia sp.]
MDIVKLVRKAENSSFYRWLLSRGLNHIVPFNKPHRFRIESVSATHLKVRLPYRKRNLNHLKGLHACAMATLAEVSSGFLLVSNLDPKKYRLILQKLEMEYHYQGKMDALAEFSFEDDWLDREVRKPLESQPALLIPCEVKIHDVDGNHLATGVAHWQIKNWEKVRTK